MTIGGMENVEVFTSEGKGRGLKATKEFWAADVIFAERAYSAVVFDSLVNVVCHTCFKRQEKLHRCGQCKFAHYCDRTCQKDAWLNHKNECSAIKRYGKVPNENIRLAARVMWRVEREGGGLTEGCLVSVDDLQSHVEHFGEEEKKELRGDVDAFLQYWPPQSQQFSMQYISRIFGVINCNGFTLSDQRGLQAVGVGIFPNLGLVNHDCWPNCTVIFNNGNHEAVKSMFHTQMRIELRALGKISEGEELTVSYIDFLNVSEERKRQLKKQYYFDCTCEHCQKGLKDDLFLGVKDDPKPSQEVVKEMIQFSKDTLEKIDKARSEGLYHKVVKLCRECLQKQEPVFADTNIYTLRMLSTVSEVLSYLQAFEEASHYARRMVDGYMKLYHPNNAQLGMAIMRTGLTNWHAGNIEVGHSMICKAYGILLVTHGPSHPITKDLEAMRMQTEMELRMFQQNEFMYHKMRKAALNNQPMQVMAEPSKEPAPALFHKKQ
ncbi:histone-lysine N-methyltransferase SMYD1 isoform X1 [Balaenoptera acutorostrata]|uniref:[histone H3]-lysine(4) N-trimethyltransferase n=2 Tax=Balaenoptera TaxID=9766 RepID=A0A8B8Z4R9_BALMU|nr:histone-lysine N-methyltransferase SMYD1 isoform X1 [Balaenoptera acutorostrata]XP_036729817.1 histone-lysine N-methyltransferase SMYD1 isoform X1 [Balaenoptera musculus]